ncbi:single-stranded DNA-binding protein [Salipaludibacillus daqingensis]|uniref:single-stranded DNA-binding protein n=1 Tax=Salipaludibacillus daqingensis TaxID=3041001 RepID=UPI0024742CE4|nr:single-stranded DNA-binding protein [Salipaludibacillus daqingensis]
MLNQFTLIGRMAKSPQLQTTKDGTNFIRFTLAVRRTFKNQAGNYDTDFIQLVAWNKLAETIADYCTKGSLISCNGRIQMRSFELDNQKRLTVPDVIAETVTFLLLKKIESHEQSVHIPQKPATSSEQPSHMNSHNETHPSPPTPAPPIINQDQNISDNPAQP